MCEKRKKLVFHIDVRHGNSGVTYLDIFATSFSSLISDEISCNPEFQPGIKFMPVFCH